VFEAMHNLRLQQAVTGAITVSSAAKAARYKGAPEAAGTNNLEPDR